MKFYERTFGRAGRRSGSLSASMVRKALLIVGIFLVSNVSCKKYNATSPVFASDPEITNSIVKSVSAMSYVNDTAAVESGKSNGFTFGTSRQSRDYNPGGGGANAGGGNSYNVGGGSGSHAAASSYGAPAVGGGGGGGYGNVAAGGGYPNPQYAIPPIVLV